MARLMMVSAFSVAQVLPALAWCPAPNVQAAPNSLTPKG